MKLLLLSVLGLLIHASAGLRCWECNNAYTNDQCLQEGRLRACTELDAICEDQVRHSEDGNQMIIEKRCKQEHACDNNVVQNLRPAFPIQCSVGSPTSVCRCCCGVDGCNRELLACWQGYTTPVPIRTAYCFDFPFTPANGVKQCTGNNEPGTFCDFRCHDNYYLVGEPRLTCLDDGRWDHREPRCQLKTCEPPFTTLGNGTIECSNGNFLRSRCTFRCNQDFGLAGKSYSECFDDPNSERFGRWSDRLPECRPLVCPRQGPLRHGTFSCTRDNKFMSVCSWRCGENFEIFPPGFDTNVCLESGRWNQPWPCCTLPCLPFAVVDLLVILDSSSSVGLENWVLMTNFVANLFDHFALQEDAAQFAVFRYNGDVDEDTAIFFDDFPNDINAFLERFRQIPYDGSGTNTGNALVYATTTALERGNRALAPDRVILITDGDSQDQVRIPGLRLRRRNDTSVLVIPVTPPSGQRIDLEEMAQIAGSRENVITRALEDGFEALDEAFAIDLAQNLCPSPCSNPFHDGEEATPTRLLRFVNSTNFN